MYKRSLFKSAVVMLLAFTMTFAPVFSTYAAIETEPVPDNEAPVAAQKETVPAQQIAEPEEAPVSETESEPADAETPPETQEQTEVKDAVSDGETDQAEQAAPEQTVPDTSSEAVKDEPAEVEPEKAVEAEAPEEPEEEKATRTKYVWKGNGVKVTAVLSDAEAVPDDAKLVVTPIAGNSRGYNYDAYMDALNRNGNKEYSEKNTLLYDIAFIKDGVEIEPEAGKVSVSFEFLDSQLSESIGAEKAEDVNVIHMPLKDKVKDKYDTTAAARNIDAGDIKVESVSGVNVNVDNEKVSFVTDSFSVFAYTVDFEYTDPDTGKVYTFNLHGEGSITLKELAVRLGITSEAKAEDFVKDVRNVEFSDESLVKVQKTILNGWVLKSRAPFTSNETLTITMNDDSVIIVRVTDSQTSSDLTDFVSNAVISGATQDSSGNYQVEQGKEYSIILSFAENSSVQFDNTAELTYTMPQGINVLTRQQGDLKINIVYKGRTYQVDATYDLDTSGNLKIKFDESDPDFPRLEESTNVSFRFTYNAQFDGSSNKILFSDDVERDIVFDEPEPGQAFAEKKAVYDEAAGVFHYTITVSATGDVTNVNVKDTISGDAIVFNSNPSDAVTVRGNSSSYTLDKNNKGFDITFASMKEGEVITIEYDATVNFDKDTDKDGKLTVDQTKNSVTVKPEGGDPHNSEYSREITFKSTNKGNGTEVDTTENGDKIIEWQIDYNPLALAAAGGDKITDKISDYSAQYMKYYGDGISIKAYDPDSGSSDPAISYSVPYSELTHTDSSWTYTIPSTHTTPYHYVITYQTIVDMEKVNGGGVAVTLDNTANNDEGTVYVGPANEISVDKDVESFTTEEVNWISTLSVPANGLTQAVVTDFLPHIYLNDAHHYDAFKEGSLDIQGLLEGEHYELEIFNDRVVITFYKSAGTTQTGLQGHEGGRNITVKLTTKVDQEWLQKGYETGDWEQNHKNTILFNTKSDVAEVVFGKPGITKTGYSQGGGSFKYTVVLSGVSELPVSVKDTFDTSLLEVDTSKSDQWDHMQIWGGTQYSQDAGKTSISYSDASDGIILTANSVPMQANGSYYPYYKIVYYLKLKPSVDLEELAIANGGTHELKNTAKWGDHESEFTYKTEYDYLDKKLLNEGELGGTNRTAKYQITFNPRKATLNDGEPMTMTDVLSSNLSVDYSSVEITTDPAGASVPYSFSGGDGGTTVGKYTIPDSTKVVVTYEADVRGNGPLKIVNKVSINGKEETVQNTKSYGSASEGEGAVASLKIVKVDGYDANKKLEGVQFKVFAENPNIDFGTGANGAKEIILTTDENGEIYLDGRAYSFYFDEVYHVQEIQEPENYGKISFDYLVTMTTDMAHVDYDHYVYYYNDSMQIKNWPLEGLVVEKQVESDDPDDKDKYFDFRISILNDDDTVDTSYNEKQGDDYEFVNGVCEFELKDKEQKMFWGFRKGTKYKVEEIDAQGFATTVSYSVFDEDGNVTETRTDSATSHTGELTQEDEVIVFKNSKTEQPGSLKIRKTVTENGSINISGEAKAELTGTYDFTIYTDEDCTTPYKDKDGNDVTVQLTIPESGAAVTSDEVTGLPAGDYYIHEAEDDSRHEHVHPMINPVKVTVEAGKTGDEAVIAEFTNNINTGEYTATTSYSGKKIWANDNPAHRPSSLDIVLKANGEALTGVSPTWTKNGNEWTYEFSNLPVFDVDGKVISYSVDEPSVPAGYTCSASTTDTSYVIGDLTITEHNPCDVLEYSIDDEYGLGFIIIKATGKHANKFIIWTHRNITAEERSKLVDAAGDAFGDFDEADTLFLSGVPMNYDHGSVTARMADNQHITLTFADTSDWARFAYGHFDGTYDPGTTTLTNTYAAGASAVLHVKKAIAEGDTWPEGKSAVFTLTAVEPTDAPMPTEEGGDTVTLTSATTGSFGEITYPQDSAGKTYKYKISETSDFGDGWTNSGDITATVVVGTTVGEDGKLPVTITYSPENDTVTNDYTTSGTATLEVKKALGEGDTWPTGKSAVFKLTAVEPTDAPMPTTAGGDTVTLTSASTGSFGEITYPQTSAGQTYKYKISETSDFGDGWTKSGDITATVVVGADDGSGELKTTVTYSPENDTVTNDYNTSGEGEVKVRKTLEGRDWDTDDSFEFTIEPVGNAPAFTPNTVTVTDESEAYTESFGTVEFTAPGTYQWTVTETHAGQTIDGVAYDSAPKTVTITVEDDGQGHLVPAEGSALVQTAGFTNTYSKSGEGEVKVLKNLVGRNWATDDSFEFTITPVGDAPAFTPNTVTVTDESADYTETFGKVKFTEAGKYQWTVTETHAGETINGIAYDSAPKTVTIEVEDDGRGGLVPKEGSALVQTAAFTNNYSAEGEGEVKVRKTLNGRDWDTDDSFEFTITPIGDAPAFTPNKVTVTDESVDYTESFGKVKLTKIGTYQWKVTETHKGETVDGITYDSEDKTVTIEVVDDGKGNLVPEEGSALVQTAAFTNEYDAKGEAQFKAKKLFNIMNAPEGKFQFELKETDETFSEELPGGHKETKANGPEGNVLFDVITYNLEDLEKQDDGTVSKDFYYTIREIIPEGATEETDYTYRGYTYDPTVHKITVTVTDNGDGTLGITATDDTGSGASDMNRTTSEEGVDTFQVNPAFENKYYSEAETQFTAHKDLTGRTLEAGTFTFELKEKNAEGKFEVIDTQSNDADGNVTFKKLKYVYDPSKGKSDIGDHEYTISEVIPEAGEGDKVSEDGKRINGIIYDETVVEVTVNVTDNDNGTMTLTYNGETEFAGADFSNTYEAEGEGEILVKKNLTGRDWTDGDSFEFELRAVSKPDGVEEQPMPETTSIEITNADAEAEYTKSFGKITFTKGGTYVYSVKETTRDGNGITCSEREKTIKFEVADDGKGSIIASENSDLIQTAEITNNYAASGTGEIKVKKTLEGRRWTNGDEFTFEISAEEGTPMPAEDSITISKSDWGKTKSFGEIEFTEAGSYTYTIKEVEGDIGGITYDADSHEVTITVKDDGKGNLVADGTPLVQTEEFVNTYDCTSAFGEIMVQKVISGREWKDDDEFEFTISASGDAPMPEEDTIVITKDDEDHIVSFGQIEFEEAGKYTYKVRETKGDAKGMKYDTKVHKVTIEVVDDGQGRLVVKNGSSLIQTVKITNTYGSVKTGDTSNILLYSIIAIAAIAMLLIVFIIRRRSDRDSE